MKYVTALYFICSFATIYGQRHFLRDSIRSTLFPNTIGTLCASETGATEDDITELISHKLPSRREGKCLVACIFEHLGISEDSIKTRVEDAAFGFLNFLKERNSPLYDISQKIVLDCGSKMYSSKSSDPCDVAFEVMSCGLQQGLTNGIENVFSTIISSNRDTLFPELHISATDNNRRTLLPDLRRLDVLKIFT